MTEPKKWNAALDAMYENIMSPPSHLRPEIRDEQCCHEYYLVTEKLIKVLHDLRE